MIIPEKLVVGDKISIISTARKITKEELIPALKALESWGLKVVLGTNLFKEDDQFSGTIEQRTVCTHLIDINIIRRICIQTSKPHWRTCGGR